ncbi:Hit Diadenosine tetraphosphate hydrolase [Pyrenophora tritici-repentis]|nr:Hit Diadenosine tetraphosphate hydrolase [Pyrenophora tritici-repentis]
MQETDLHYPPETCPFCNIAAAFPFPSPTQRSTPHLWAGSSITRNAELASCIPDDEESAPDKTSPSSFVVLRSRDVVAFLDILPMTGGFWLPLLARTVAKVTGVTDYNIVQNNGARAAQVVPHVHFHIIPRPETMPEIKNKSWTMFGRGQRDDLDDEDGSKMAGEMRKVLREEVGKMSVGDGSKL